VRKTLTGDDHALSAGKSGVEHLASDRVRTLELSASSAMMGQATSLRAAGRDIISMAVGELDFNTPDHVAAAAERAARQGFTRYTAPDGHPVIKEAVRVKLIRDNKLSYSHSELHVASGCKQVIFNAFASTVNPEDEVVILAPYWTSYPEIVRFCGGRAVVVPTRSAEGFRPSPQAVERALSPRTKWIVLNSPNNPTGAIYPSGLLAELAAVISRHPRAMILSDEIYEHLVYDGNRHVSIVEIAPQLRHRVLMVNGVSKAYAMTGWRIGFGAGPQWLIEAMAKVQSQTSGNSCSIAQAAAAEALLADQSHIALWRDALERRRDRALAILETCPWLQVRSIDGSFYAFLDVERCIGAKTPDGTLIESDDHVAEYLLSVAGVATIAGSAFGAWPFIRLSFALDQSAVETACRRIVGACAALEQP
jgi:aspartate aminotransferase